MTKKNVFQCNCPLARATELLGEPWTLMVLREAFLGTRRFNDFERELGIARNILSSRLRKLVERGVLERCPSRADKRIVEYRLTEAGHELLPVLVGLAQWSGTWLGNCSSAMRFVERDSGREVPRVDLRNADGRVLRAADLAIVPGPGADSTLDHRLRRAVGERG